MNCSRWLPEQVFVYRHPVDMRKQIQGLAVIVSAHLVRDPADESLYVFINKDLATCTFLCKNTNNNKVD